MVLSRQEIVSRLKAQNQSGRPIIGCGAGTGISAKFAEAGGADLLVIYNSGRYRMAGRGSLAGLMPFGDANEIVVDMASEVLTVVEQVPVLAGVCATDPFRLMTRFLHQLKEIGFAGVQNFPTVGLIDGEFRRNLEGTEMGYEKEISMIHQAHHMEFFTSPYVFNADDAREMALAGADQLVAHVGLTASGSIGAAVSKSMDVAIEKVIEIADAGRRVNNEILVIAHGGPFDEPDNVGAALEAMPGVNGFFGASSIERLPTERAISNQVRALKSLQIFS